MLIPRGQAIPFLSMFPTEMLAYMLRKTCTRLFISKRIMNYTSIFIKLNTIIKEGTGAECSRSIDLWHLCKTHAHKIFL